MFQISILPSTIDLSIMLHHKLTQTNEPFFVFHILKKNIYIRNIHVYRTSKNSQHFKWPQKMTGLYFKVPPKS